MGDWIKVDTIHEITDEEETFEGMVMEIDVDWIVTICPQPPEDHKRVATRWAKKALKERKSVIRKQTVDA